MITSTGITLLLIISINGAASSTCSAPADILIILDESGSISSTNFELMKTFATTVVQNITIGTAATDARVALITYSSTAQERFHLDTYSSKADVISGIKGISQVGGSTYTDRALALGKISTFTSAKGDRASVPNICIIVTDGRSSRTSSTIAAAKEVRDSGIFLFAIGVGNADKTELQNIASDPNELYVFNINDFNYLSDVAQKIAPKACAIASTNGAIVGQSCTSDEDCSKIKDTKCDSEKTCQCSLQSTTYDIEKLFCRERVLGDHCITAADCTMVADSSCNCNSQVAGDQFCLFGDYVCSCSPPFVNYKGQCQKCELGKNCPEGRDCSPAIPNSVCKRNSGSEDFVEQCAGGWVLNGAFCRAMVLGVDPCQSSSDCLSTASCEGGVCLCREAYKIGVNKVKCIARALYEACDKTAQCEGVDNAECSLGVCRCGTAYIEENFGCRARGVGERCTKNGECQGLLGGGVCGGSGQCGCSSGYKVNGVGCRERLVGEKCSQSDDCSAIEFAICETGQCSCDTSAVREGDKCVLMGASSADSGNTGAIIGGVIGALAALAVGVGVGAMVVHTSLANAKRRKCAANTAAKALDAMRVQTEMCTSNVEKVCPGMTPQTCIASPSAPPQTVSYISHAFTTI